MGNQSFDIRLRWWPCNVSMVLTPVKDARTTMRIRLIQKILIRILSYLVLQGSKSPILLAGTTLYLCPWVRFPILSSRNCHAWVYGQRCNRWCVWLWSIRTWVAGSFGQILSFNSVNLVGSPKYSGKLSPPDCHRLRNLVVLMIPECPMYVGSLGGQTQ